MADAFGNWTLQFRKGLLDLCVLNLLDGGDRYGYELAKMLRDQPGLGTQEGVLYPLLARLRFQKLISCRMVESPDGPKRKYYALTADGKQSLKRMNTHAKMLFRTLATLGVK